MIQLLTTLIATLTVSSGIALATAGPGCATGDKQAANTTTDTTAKSCGTESKTATAQAYNTANWPTHNTNLTSKDIQGQPLPVSYQNETWITEQVSTEGKVVVLEFWATWCPPCRAASPILSQLQKENQDSLAVLAISGRRESESVVRAYIQENPVSYTHIFDDDQNIFEPFESKRIPLAAIISSDGIIRWIGNPHDEAFLPAVNQTIAADPAVQAQKTAQADAEKTSKIDG